jgi:hypothetical protein
MRARPVALFIALALLAGGCGGGDDGLRTEDNALETPAQASPATEAPPLAEPGLLTPKKRVKEKLKREKRKKRAREAKQAKQEVAGESREHEAGSGQAVEQQTTSEGSLGVPEADPVEADGEGTSLTDEQRDELAAVRATLRTFFTRLNARDSAICTELLTQRHVEEATGLSGQAAVARCRDDVAGSTTTYSLNKISGVRVEGDFALIRFASSIGDYARWEIFRAQRTGDGWRFDGNGSADV